MTLDSPDPHLSASASALLAQVHAKQLRSLLAYPTSPRNQPANLEPWIALLTRDTAERLAQLRHTALLPAPVAALQAAAAAEPVAAGEGAAAGGSEAAAGAAGEAAAAGAAAAVPPAEASDDEPAAAAAPPAEWWQPPAVLSRPGAGPGEVEAAAVHCERILKYLATLVEECQVSSHVLCIAVHLVLLSWGAWEVQSCMESMHSGGRRWWRDARPELSLTAGTNPPHTRPLLLRGRGGACPARSLTDPPGEASH